MKGKESKPTTTENYLPKRNSEQGEKQESTKKKAIKQLIMVVVK
jgi:hypothetical protein